MDFIWLWQDNLVDCLHIMIQVEDILSQQVILSSSSPQFTRRFLYVSAKSPCLCACLPLYPLSCRCDLNDAGSIRPDLILSLHPSVTFSVCLPVTITITCFFYRHVHIYTEELDAGACWLLYWPTWIHIQYISRNSTVHTTDFISVLQTKSPSLPIAICCQ